MTAPTTVERLTFLRAHVYPTGAKPYTYVQLAELLGKRGVDISSRALSNLFRGEVATPQPQVLDGLAGIFGVAPDVFHYDSKQWAEVEEWITVSAQLVSQTQLSGSLTTQQIIDRNAQRYRARKIAKEQQRLLQCRADQHATTPNERPPRSS